MVYFMALGAVAVANLSDAKFQVSLQLLWVGMLSTTKCTTSSSHHLPLDQPHCSTATTQPMNIISVDRLGIHHLSSRFHEKVTAQFAQRVSVAM